MPTSLEWMPRRLHLQGHFDIGPYKTTFRKHCSNIGSHIYVACLTAIFVLFPLYPLRPIESASCRPQVDDFPFSIISIIRLLTIQKLFRARSPRQPMWWITFARDTHYLRVRLSTATYWSYVKRAALYRTFISQSFVSGNNSNDPVAGSVSGVVVDEDGHAVCLPSVTWNVVVLNGGWSLMRGVVNEGFYCIMIVVYIRWRVRMSLIQETIRSAQRCTVTIFIQIQNTHTLSQKKPKRRQCDNIDTCLRHSCLDRCSARRPVHGTSPL